MNIIHKISLTQGQRHAPFNPRKVCRIICDNMHNDYSIELLGKELNLRPDPSKKEISEAVKALIKRLPYYSIIETNDYAEIIPVRLVRTMEERVYKVLPETNIINWINTIINDKIFKGVILPLNKYIYVGTQPGRPINMCEFTVCSQSKNICFNEVEYWNSEFRIQFLMDRQLPDVPIYSFIEHAEGKSIRNQIAYLFTVSEYKGITTIVMENNSLNTATYIFKVYSRYLEVAIEQIINYFESELSYKRLKFLCEDTLFSEKNGFINRQKIIHRDLINWMKDMELINVDK